MKPDEWDDITEPRASFPSSMPTEAPPTERDLEPPTEVPEPPMTLPAPPDIPNDRYRDKLPSFMDGARPPYR